MSINNYKNKIYGYYNKITGNTIDLTLSDYTDYLTEINEFYTLSKNNSETEIKSKSVNLKKRIHAGETEEEILAEAFALVKIAIERTLNIVPFGEQMIAGIAINKGRLVEMQTGEGKTLMAVFPAFLNALSGKGVHILTFNDYLAERDAAWMRPVYEYLKVSVAFIKEGMSVVERKKAYNADITYMSARECGFDYLRDALRYSQTDKRQRPFNFAIIDEADSILIDEARIPLIIAGSGDDENREEIKNAALVSASLIPQMDFYPDKYSRNIILTDNGVDKIEKILNLQNLYDITNTIILSRIYCALHANYLLKQNIDYIIKNGHIELVDEFTGRIADKRRWPDGIQEALEEKEGLTINCKGRALNSITLQNFINLFPKLSGMTATAKSAADEFREFYGLEIVVIPTHKKSIRIDYPDLLFYTKKARNDALITEIIECNKTGRPVLVGTCSIKESIAIADFLKEKEISVNILNAKNDALEAEIISDAGKLFAVTISTNMAGRGADIKLGGGDEINREKLLQLGGLYVIGTNKHESKRIDYQLRGRAGRQGDPGSSRFFICLEDDLFVKYHVNEFLKIEIGNKSPFPIEERRIQKEAERIQRVVEGQNLEIKKTLAGYSSLLENQRQIMLLKRDAIFTNNSVIDLLWDLHKNIYDNFVQTTGEKETNLCCRILALAVHDKIWCEYLDMIAELREGIALNRFGGLNPLIVFRKKSIEIFDCLEQKFINELNSAFPKVKIENGKFCLNETGLRIPSGTWTYLINDNPFENMPGLDLMNNIAFASNAGLMGFLLIITELFKRRRKSKI